jgi:DNA-binding MarR family transcriptional regulator
MAVGREELVAALVREMPWYISASVRYQIAVAHQLGMPVADVHAIGALLELGEVGAGRLAEVMGMTTGAVTRMVDRLARAGYVRRESDPEDRRRVVLVLVRERLTEITRLYESMGDRWQAQLDGCTDDQLAFLVEFLRTGRADAQAATAELRADGRAHGTRRART